MLREGDPSDAAVTQLLSYEADDWGWAGGVFPSPADRRHRRQHGRRVARQRPVHVRLARRPRALGDEAGAAGTPNAPSGFTGVAFLLVFSTPSDPKFLRIITTASSLHAQRG